MILKFSPQMWWIRCCFLLQPQYLVDFLFKDYIHFQFYIHKNALGSISHNLLEASKKTPQKLSRAWYCCVYETATDSTTFKRIPSPDKRKPAHNECFSSYMPNSRKGKLSQQIMLPGNVKSASQMMSWEKKNTLKFLGCHDPAQKTV